jgi:hypothetical protein
MPKIARTVCCLLLSASIGCGGGPPSTSDSGTPPPHQGNLVRVPGGKGFVEVVQKKAESATTPIAGEVTFYFLKDDGTSPVSPAPSTGTLAVGKQKITLKPEGDGLATPSGKPLFAKSGGVDGELSVDLDGKSVTIPLGVR